MYQPLIWPAHLRHQARGLGSAVDAQDMQRSSNSLIDCVWRNVQLDGDFLGRKVQVDQAQAIELAGAQPRHSGRKLRVRVT